MNTDRHARPPWRLDTRTVHLGERVPLAGLIPTSTPIYQTTSFMYETAEDLDQVFAGEATGYTYSRMGNPTVRAVTTALAGLEDAEHCVVSGSGMAALHMALLAAGIGAGDRVVAASDLYATTYTLLNAILTPLGVKRTFVDIFAPGALEEALAGGDVRVVLVEALSNPLLRLADIPTIAAIAHAHGALLIVDATFTPPPLGSPLAQGADLVVHSATKYLSGHADLTAGVVYGNGDAAATLPIIHGTLGSLLSPHDSWLLLRGLKTLPLRLRRQCASARMLARRLAAHPRVSHINFPGLPQHPQHALARQLLARGCFGAMISFELRDAGQAEVFRFLNSLQLCVPAVSLGDIYTLVSCPSMASHRELTPRQRQAMGISTCLIRLSIGIEHPSDLAADLTAALDLLDEPATYVPATPEDEAAEAATIETIEEPAP